MDPSTGNNFSGGNTTGQGSAPGGAAPTGGMPVNGGTTSGGMSVNSSAPTGGMPVNNAVSINRTSVNGGASVINRIPTSNVMSMNGSTANSGMPVDVGRAQSNEGDIVLNPSSNRRKKSKLFVAIAIIMVLIIVGVGVAVYFINDNNLKSNIKARWANYYNMLVYGSIEKPEGSRDSISDESNRWFLSNLDDSLEKMNYDSYEQYFRDLKVVYDDFLNISKGNSILRDSGYGELARLFFDYNLIGNDVDRLEEYYLKNGFDAAEKFISDEYDADLGMMEYYLSEYFGNELGLMKAYDDGGCYDSNDKEWIDNCKDTLNNNETSYYYGLLNNIYNDMKYYYENAFLNVFYSQTMEISQRIGVEYEK